MPLPFRRRNRELVPDLESLVSQLPADRHERIRHIEEEMDQHLIEENVLSHEYGRGMLDPVGRELAMSVLICSGK